VAAQITATTRRSRPAPRLGVLEVALLAVIAAAVIGVVAWSQAGSVRDVTVDSHAYGVGFPLHGGLAGPSRVGQTATVGGPSQPTSTVDLAGLYGRGYPLHGGLAGPSRPLSGVDAGEHYGPGYPLNGGLAGPSGVNNGE
jgi:hypothetical protein